MARTIRIVATALAVILLSMISGNRWEMARADSAIGRPPEKTSRAANEAVNIRQLFPPAFRGSSPIPRHISWPGIAGISASFSIPAAERIFYYNLIVKMNPGYYGIYCEDGYSWPFRWDVINISFSPAVAPVNISPESNDPGVKTDNPFTIEPCPIDVDGDGQREVAYTPYFRSLKDIGEWRITFNGTWVDPACCQSAYLPPCNVICNELCVFPWAEPATAVFTVYNEPPVASITHSPAPAWNTPITLNAHASDADGGSLKYYWSILQKPATSTLTLSNANAASPSLQFSGDKDIGDWVIQLNLDDDEGERRTYTHQLTVPNIPPAVSVTGATAINTLQPISLQVTPTTDVDGGDLEIVWDILQCPPRSTHHPQNGFATTPQILLPTSDKDIGVWKFRVTAKDNEKATDVKEVVVEVRNIPPEINLAGLPEIDAGQTIRVETSVLDDADGGVLSFQWDIVQAPLSSAVQVQEAYLSGTGPAAAALEIPTSPASAGTWIVRLKARDDDNAADSEQAKVFTVLVDAPPHAEINGPATIGSFSFPLTLRSDNSIDPDSPCTAQPDRCHASLDPPVKNISPGIISYTWSLVDVPFELWTKYPLGIVNDVFFVSAHDPTMTLNLGDLEPGAWTFQLDVVDGEGNAASNCYTVTVVEANGLPIAVVNGPARYTVNTAGGLDQNITLSGYQSYDLDNLLDGEEIGPGMGISEYKWEVIQSPPGCSPPTLPSGSSAQTVNLYSAGAVVHPACQGNWIIRLQVRDDDTPAKTGQAQTSVIIGNCPDLLCIDYPTTNQPQIVEFVENTDILIHYHLDSALYDNPAFVYGMFTTLEIFHESDLTTPFFTATDPNVLGSNKGGYLVFHWNGYGDSLQRPKPGFYTIKISPLNAGFGSAAFFTVQPRAISIAVATLEILPTSDLYVDFNKMKYAQDQVTINYQINGGATPDELRWRIRDASDSIIFETSISAGLTGQINWNGMATGGSLSPGFYKFELEALRAGSSLGISNPHTFVIYRLSLTPGTGAASGTPPGLFVFVNSDDDNRNNVADLTEIAAGENDLTQLNIAIEPSMEGVATLSSSNTAIPFKLWNTATKGGERTLPASFNMPADTVPAQLFVEGQRAARSDLRLQLLTKEGVTLGPETLAMTLIEIKVMSDSNNDHSITAADLDTYSVRIARWDNAYDATFAVINTADPGNFIEQDSSRFYLVVRNPLANADPAIAEQITIRLGTINGGGVNDDDLTDVTLFETGVNTGEFVSRSQILTSRDIQVNDDPNADDEFTAHNGGTGTAPDDQPGDRTHRAEIDGAMRIQYQPGTLPSAKTLDVPVCQRSPEARRKVQIRVHVFKEPFHDTGLDGIPGTGDAGEGNGVFNFTDTNGNSIHDAGEPSEPYIDLSHGGAAPLSGAAVGVANGWGPVVTDVQVTDQLRRADIAWTQACIKTEQLGPILIENAPAIMGVNILIDGLVDLPSAGGDDITPLYTAYSAVMRPHVLDIFFAAPISGATAIAFPPNNTMIAHGENSFVVLAPNLPINFRTLAHELGHIFTNQPDSAQGQVIFFPQSNPVGAGLLNDGAVNLYRRIRLSTETDARTVRPAGSPTATGNSVLRIP